MSRHSDYDHELKIDSTTEKFRLVVDDSGAGMYRIENVILPQQDPFVFAQTDWTGGYGQYQVENPAMYFDGQSIDTTQDGRVILAPLITEASYSAASTVQENYITGNDTQYNFYGSTWAAQTFTPASAHTIDTVKIKAYRLFSPGTITLSIRATSSSKPTGSDLTSGTLDGNTLTTSTAGDWAVFNLDTKIALTVSTMYAIVVRCAGQSASYGVNWCIDGSAATYAGGAEVVSADSGATWTIDTDNDFMFSEYSAAATEMDTAPVLFFWSTTASKWLCATAGKIYYYDVAWTAATTTVVGVKSFAEFNGYVFAALGAANAYVYSTDCITWTTCTVTDHHADGFYVSPNAAGTANVLWKFTLNNELKSNTSGINGGAEWTTAAYIGESSNYITNLFRVGDQLMIGRTDNLFWYDSTGGIHAYMDDLRINRSSANFKYICTWRENVYFSLQRSMGELTPSLSFTIGRPFSSISSISPLAGTGDIDKVGDVVGITSDRDWLYVAMLEGTTTTIYKGGWDESGRWSWCPFVYLGTNACLTINICQHSSTDRRLWFGYGTHTGYAILTENPTTDDSARFCPSGNVRMSYVYGTNPYWDKLWQSVVTETTNCTAGRTVQPKYRKDTETSMTNLTASITSNGVIRTNLTTALAGTRIQFELDLATDDSTQTPQVLMFQARGVEKPENVRVHEAVYAIGDQPSDRAKTLRDLLRTAGSTTNLIRFADLRFNEYTSGTAGTDFVYCTMEPSYPQEVQIEHEGGRAPEMAIRVRLREIPVSASISATVTTSLDAPLQGLLPGTALVVASDADAATKVAAQNLQITYGSLIQICDGTADDVQIQAAIDAVVSSSISGIVHITPGNYSLTSGVEVDLSSYPYVLKIDAEGAKWTYSGGVANGILYLRDQFTATWEPSQRVVVIGLTIKGNANPTAGIYLRSMAGCVFERVMVRDCDPEGNGYGVFIYDGTGDCAEYNTFRNCSFLDNAVGTYVVAVNGGAANTRFEDCDFSFNGVNNANCVGISIGGLTMARSLISNCVFHMGGAAGQIGIYIDSPVNGLCIVAPGFDNHSALNAVKAIVSGASATGTIYIDGIQGSTSGGTLTFTDFSLGSLTPKIRGSDSYITESSGVASNVTLDGSGVGAIAHGCSTTPTYANVICQSDNLNVRVSSIDATNINILVKDLDNAVVTADTHDFYWEVK